MHWGRKRRERRQDETQACPEANAVLIAGTLSAALFLCLALSGRGQPDCPPALSAEAAAAFTRENTALSAVLGLDAPSAAVSAGSFDSREAGRTFGECLREAALRLWGLR